MYIGSVRFFKHLILAVIVLTITSLAAGIIVLAQKNKELEDQIWMGGPAGPTDPVTTTDPTDPDPTNPTTDPATDPTGGEEITLPTLPGTGMESEPSFAYQLLYPDLYGDGVVPYRTPAGKTVYLTFDDGPSRLTDEILDTLKEHNVKATFFVIGRNIVGREDALRRIVEEGHVLALHSYSHVYRDIYASVDSFLEDFNKVYELVEQATGVRATIFRFPGGSINSYNVQTFGPIIAEMVRRGFSFYDWNVSAGDAVSRVTSTDVRNNILADLTRFDQSIVLMHEVDATVEALEQLIRQIEEEGYAFDVLTNAVKPVIFPYPS